MYMQNERPYGGPKITSRTQQTDKSYFMKNPNQPQNNMQDDDNSKPSQTDPSCVYDEYMRNRAPDSQPPTCPAQNFYGMGNIRYPTHFMPGIVSPSVKDNKLSTVLLCACETGLSYKCKSQPSVPLAKLADDEQTSAVSCLSKSTPDVPSCYKSVPSEPCFLRIVSNEKSNLSGWCSQESSISPVFCPAQATSNRKAQKDPKQIVCKSSTFGNSNFAENTPNTSNNDCAYRSTKQCYATARDGAKSMKTEDKLCSLKKCQRRSFPVDHFAEKTFEAQSDDTNWHSASSQPKPVKNMTTFPLKTPSQMSREYDVQRTGTKTTFNTCPSQQSGSSRTPFNKSSMGCTENTSSRSQSVMAKVTCLCSSEQKANLCNCGRKPNDGPPFTRLEDQILAPSYFESQSTKVMFTKSGEYCDCSSSSNTSLHHNEVASQYSDNDERTENEMKTQSVEEGESRCDPITMSETNLKSCSCTPTYEKSMKSCFTNGTGQENMCTADISISESNLKSCSCTPTYQKSMKSCFTNGTGQENVCTADISISQSNLKRCSCTPTNQTSLKSCCTNGTGQENVCTADISISESNLKSCSCTPTNQKSLKSCCTNGTGQKNICTADNTISESNLISCSCTPTNQKSMKSCNTNGTGQKNICTADNTISVSNLISCSCTPTNQKSMKSCNTNGTGQENICTADNTISETNLSCSCTPTYQKSMKSCFTNGTGQENICTADNTISESNLKSCSCTPTSQKSMENCLTNGTGQENMCTADISISESNLKNSGFTPTYQKSTKSCYTNEAGKEDVCAVDISMSASNLKNSGFTPTYQKSTKSCYTNEAGKEDVCAVDISMSASNLKSSSFTPSCQKSTKSCCTNEAGQEDVCAVGTSKNNVNDTDYHSCTTCHEGIPVERVLHLLDYITNPKESNGDRFEMVHQLFRELTSLLRNEEEGSRSAPLTYEECMDAVTAGKKPEEKLPKTKEQMQRMQCLNQMEQYLNKCYPQKRNVMPQIEIAATEPDPDFNPNNWNQIDNNNVDEPNFGDCQSSHMISIGDFNYAEGGCIATQEEQSKTYKSCDINTCIEEEKVKSLLSEYCTDVGDSLPQDDEVISEPCMVQEEVTLKSEISECCFIPQEEVTPKSEISEKNIKPAGCVPQQQEVKDDKLISQKAECSFKAPPEDPLGPLTERERLLCEYLLCRMGEVGDEECYLDEQTDDCHPPLESQPCVCCHCRALICDNQCKTITKALDTVMYDPVAEMKFFIDSIIFDMQAMEQVMKKNNLCPKSCNPSACMGNAPGDSFPVTITDVSSLGCRALYVQWELHDCSGIGGYEIYVDGHLTNRFYSYRHEAGVVSNVDVTKGHQIVLRAQAIGQEFGIDECERNQIAMVHAHPEMQVGAQQPWSPSVYFYEP